MLETIRRRYGTAERIWITDRGIPTEEILTELRAVDSPVRYLVGTPKGRLTRYEAALAKPLAGGAPASARQTAGARRRNHAVPSRATWTCA